MNPASFLIRFARLAVRPERSTMPRLQDTLSWVIVVLLALWFLYLAYKIAEHVGAWPFG